MKKNILIALPKLFLAQFALLACTAIAQTTAVPSSSTLIEWEFDSTRYTYKVNPAQADLVSAENFEGIFYPDLSERHDQINPSVTKHADNVYHAFMYASEPATLPFLVQVNDSLPSALGATIKKGARVFSFSIGIRTEGIPWPELENIFLDHPNALVLAATPHITGNEVSVQTLNEYPSRMALDPRFSNVLLIGCLRSEYYDMNLGKQVQITGTKEDPFQIENQRSGDAPIVYLKDCNQVGELISDETTKRKFGATSAATPVFSRMVYNIIQDLESKGADSSAPEVLNVLRAKLKHGYGSEKFLCKESPVPCPNDSFKSYQNITREVLYLEL